MPLFFEQDINEETRLAVWHITEDEPFFRSMAVPQREVLHPHKRLQHLAGRYLLRHLFPDFPSALIRIADTRKPFLEDDPYHFSISHCADFAAAIVSRQCRVGVDIEVVTEKALRIRPKFASEAEWALVGSSSALGIYAGAQIADPSIPDKEQDAVKATLIWSSKEALFKWYGLGEVDFKEHMVLQGCSQTGTAEVDSEILFQKEKPETLVLHSRLLERLWLTYVVQ